MSSEGTVPYTLLMFGLRVKEKNASEVRSGEYVVLGGIKLLHVREVVEMDGFFQIATELGNFLFSPSDVLRVI
jgi:hypothetical protein